MKFIILALTITVVHACVAIVSLAPQSGNCLYNNAVAPSRNSVKLFCGSGGINNPPTVPTRAV